VDLAEDLTQTTFLRFLRSVKGGKKIRFPKSYLLKVADNVVNHYLNEGKKTELVMRNFSDDDGMDDKVLDVKANDPGVEAYILMREAISQLDNTTQEVIIYREFEGRPYEEISKITGLSRRQIDYLIKKAAKKVQEHLH
jgi:RNA polymerase sigma factor (sigma-70 family)